MVIEENSGVFFGGPIVSDPWLLSVVGTSGPEQSLWVQAETGLQHSAVVKMPGKV